MLVGKPQKKWSAQAHHPLFDLAVDVHEQADLARRRPDDLAALRAAWAAINAGLLPYRA
jgi:hypothetical protein